MSQLSIYKASAGSGKTFRLTGEFLNLIFKFPENYRRILAVTFTNKATAEMKARILNELNILAKGQQSAYAHSLNKEYGFSDTELQYRAKKILSFLLHDFSKFSVSTIDKFFQKIIRAFVREIGIQPGYSIELNQNEVLAKVTDELLLEIDTNLDLQKWLSGLASEKIEKGEKWDFKDDIKKLAGEILKEEFLAFDQDLINKMHNKEFLKEYINDLRLIVASFENSLDTIAQKALDLIKTNALEISDFKYGKASVPNFFNKLKNKDYELKKRTIDGAASYDMWLPKNDKKDIIEGVLNNGLFDLLNEAINYRNNNFENYNTAIQIQKLIQSLGILTDLSRKVHEYCREQNIFLISDSAKLLQTIIDDNESPFIYEKTGNTFKHFMIDEFQDTSKIQWHNFRPLIENSLALGSENLVVGDIKQSIYRWRNSDWKILSDQIQDEFKHYSPKVESLTTNWRSKKNIIDFNNAIFCYSSQVIQNYYNSEFETSNSNPNPYQTKISDSYADVYQDSPATNTNQGGYIKHTFLHEKEYNYNDEIKIRLPEIIKDLQDKSYRLKDIAILVRRGQEGQEIANILIEAKNQNQSDYKFDFISSDSLYLANSSLVKFLVSILEFILNPNDDINIAFIAYEYHQYLKKLDLNSEDLHNLIHKHPDEERENWLKKIFPTQFIKSFAQIKQLPIYELIDQLVRIFDLSTIKHEQPYLSAFLDIILEFSKKTASDIHSFLVWWNESGIKKTLSISEDQDAIRIITVHSSKGLEFKNLIIPFCNWDIDHKAFQNNIMWCKTHVEPFNKLDLIPVKYSKSLIDTVFKENYQNEKLHAFVDNINLLYVAFTRAKENLFVFSPLKAKSTGIKTVGDLLFYTYNNYQKLSSKGKDLVGFTDSWDPEKNILELGNLSNNTVVSEQTNNEFELTCFDSYNVKNKLRVKLHDNSFFTGKDSTPYEKVNYGKIMHEIFENIELEEDIPLAIEKLIIEGKISVKEKNNIENRIKETLSNKQVKSWFSSVWEIKNEAELILPNGSTLRPDRVLIGKDKVIVIDYKFGEQQEDKHIKQVKSYMDIIKKIEDKTTEGYLWYVDLNKIIEVKK